MLFFESTFIMGFVLLYGTYIFLRDKYRNHFILLMSYFFYGTWDWRFLSLLLISTFIDYLVSNLMGTSSDAKRKKLLYVSIFANIGMLGIFKYYDFFAGSFASLAGEVGFDVSPVFLNFVLPAGISFYTFQTLSYTIDVYRKTCEAEKNPVNFAAYVAFFPQLIAGPIERANDLLVQFSRSRVITIEGFVIGLRLFMWGVFKKLFIADNLGNIVDPVFASPSNFDTITLIIALYAFAFQIYCDFSGYTDMARGLAKTMGFELSINFNLPYFSKSLSDFWRRWHITLGSWIRDYVYIPLGGSRCSNWKVYRNLLLTMALCGLWHGAGLNFILWGIYNGAIMAAERLFKDTKLTSFWHKMPNALRVFICFNVVCFGWLLFRSPDLHVFYIYCTSIVKNFPTAYGLQDAANWSELIEAMNESFLKGSLDDLVKFLIFVVPLLLVQVWQNKYKNPLFDIAWPSWLKGSVYGVLVILVLTLGVSDGKQFIYFQF